MYTYKVNAVKGNDPWCPIASGLFGHAKSSAIRSACCLARIDAPARDTPEGAAGRRFVRKQLAAPAPWSGVDFARHMGVDAATVSRWEAGQRMGASAERLLRLAVSVGTPAQDYSLDHLATDLSETTEHVPMRFECADDAWRLVA